MGSSIATAAPTFKLALRVWNCYLAATGLTEKHYSFQYISSQMINKCSIKTLQLSSDDIAVITHTEAR